MAKPGKKPIEKKPAKEQRVKVSQSEFSGASLSASERIAQALWDHFAGKSAAPHEIAMAITMSPMSFPLKTVPMFA